jgi:hypothetical protein
MRMNIGIASVFAAAICAASLPAQGLDTSIPVTGLPSAADYGAQLLPERLGVVSWKTLAQVEPVRQGDKMVLRFSPDVLGLDQKDVRVQGFIIPLDMSDKQSHFLLSAVPPHCPFCLPAGPDALVEVHARKALQYSFEPIVIAGRFAVLKSDPAGVRYRMTDAEPVAAASR